MADLIDRQALIAYLASRTGDFIDDYGKGWSAGVTAALDTLRKLPAVDAEPVRHGRWEIDEFGCFCSACREYAADVECGEDCQLVPMHSPYCPNCGADMRGE